MDPMLEKSSDKSRALLFGLLVNCLFPTNREEDCPLRELRGSLSIEQKFEYAMAISSEKVKSILDRHESCYQRRIPDPSLW